MCATGVGAGVGAALIVGGASMLVSETLSASGVEGKTASLISNGLSVVAGTALCFTPLAGLGASMVGSGVGGIAGGYISESLGGSFELGASIGGMLGGIAGAGLYSGFQALGSTRSVQAIGSAFNPKMSTQIGVDPYTLKINRTLNPDKIVAVRNQISKNGMYGVIQVMRDGTIIDGNHRVHVARLLKISVDVIIR